MARHRVHAITNRKDKGQRGKERPPDNRVVLVNTLWTGNDVGVNWGTRGQSASWSASRWSLSVDGRWDRLADSANAPTRSHNADKQGAMSASNLSFLFQDNTLPSGHRRLCLGTRDRVWKIAVSFIFAGQQKLVFVVVVVKLGHPGPSQWFLKLRSLSRVDNRSNTAWFWTHEFVIIIILSSQMIPSHDIRFLSTFALRKSETAGKKRTTRTQKVSICYV